MEQRKKIEAAAARLVEQLSPRGKELLKQIDQKAFTALQDPEAAKAETEPLLDAVSQELSKPEQVSIFQIMGLRAEKHEAQRQTLESERTGLQKLQQSANEKALQRGYNKEQREEATLGELFDHTEDS